MSRTGRVDLGLGVYRIGYRVVGSVWNSTDLAGDSDFEYSSVSLQLIGDGTGLVLPLCSANAHTLPE